MAITDRAYLDRNLEKPFHIIVKLQPFFNLLLILYFTSSRGGLYIFHLYMYLVAFILSSVVYKLFVLLSVIIDCAEDRPVTYKKRELCYSAICIAQNSTVKKITSGKWQ